MRNLRCGFLAHSLVVLGIVAGAGCGKDVSHTTTPDSPPAVSDAPPLVGDRYGLTWGPISVPPMTESTQCIWLKLSNTTQIKVHQIHNVLTDGSHHLIVYKDDMDTTEQTTPMPCQPFTGALNASGMISPIVITQKKDDEITLPDGVAYTFAPGQMIKLELHYINASTTDTKMIGATVDFYGADPATIHDEAAILFTGTVDISLPPNTMTTVHQFFTVPSYLDLSQANIFAVTGHEHQLGLNATASVGASKTGTLTPVYNPNPFVWSEPATQVQTPAFSIPKGGGLDMTCTWFNSTANTVTFGEKTTNEMCFFWMYYYPSQGSKVCFHTEQIGGANGLNFCCPGDSLCSMAPM